MERQSGFNNNNLNNDNNHRNGPGGKTMNSDGSWSDNRDNNSGENNNDENNDRCENFERFLTGFNLDNSKTCVRNQNTNGPCGFPGGANVCDTEADEEVCNESFGGDDSTTCAECEGGLCVPEEEREQGCFCDTDDDCADDLVCISTNGHKTCQPQQCDAATDCGDANCFACAGAPNGECRRIVPVPSGCACKASEHNCEEDTHCVKHVCRGDACQTPGGISNCDTSDFGGPGCVVCGANKKCSPITKRPNGCNCEEDQQCVSGNCNASGSCA
jgi:hypothetical protein